MKKEFMTDINKIKFEVYREMHRSIAAVSIKKEKSSVSVYGLLRDIPHCRAVI